MRIYLASSWKNTQLVLHLAKELRKEGHQVDAFCDYSTGRFVFHWSELTDDIKQTDAVEFLKNTKTQRAYQEDRRWIDWANVVILVMPCGRSAHLEAGYAKGKGKLLFIYGEFPKGEFEVMYGFADALYRIDQLSILMKTLNNYENPWEAENDNSNIGTA